MLRDDSISPEFITVQLNLFGVDICFHRVDEVLPSMFILWNNLQVLLTEILIKSCPHRQQNCSALGCSPLSLADDTIGLLNIFQTVHKRWLLLGHQHPHRWVVEFYLIGRVYRVKMTIRVLRDHTLGPPARHRIGGDLKFRILWLDDKCLV